VTIPPSAFEMPLDALKLSEHVTSMLFDARYVTAGDLAVQYRMNPDVLLALQGMSPKAMTEIETALQNQRLMGIVKTPVVEELPAEELPVEKLVDETITVGTEPEVEVAKELVLEPVIEVEDDLPADLNQIFALKPEVFEVPAATDEDEESPDAAKKSGGKKKKKKSVEVEYDPDRDVLLTHKKHKRGDETGWGNW